MAGRAAHEKGTGKAVKVLKTLLAARRARKSIFDVESRRKVAVSGVHAGAEVAESGVHASIYVYIEIFIYDIYKN